MATVYKTVRQSVLKPAPLSSGQETAAAWEPKKEKLEKATPEAEFMSPKSRLSDYLQLWLTVWNIDLKAQWKNIFIFLMWCHSLSWVQVQVAAG